MEAKVDVRKLQMLNDRIIQTLEALTQVRASVHGIGQSSPYSSYGQTSPYAQTAHPGQSPYGQIGPHVQSPYPQGQIGGAWPQALGHSPALSPYAPFASSPFQQLGLPIGLSHSSYGQVPGLTPWHPFPQQVQGYPYAQHYAQAQWPPQASWSPFTTMGLSHSGIDEVERRMVEQRASDVGRMMQTFPYGAYV